MPKQNNIQFENLEPERTVDFRHKKAYSNLLGPLEEPVQNLLECKKKKSYMSISLQKALAYSIQVFGKQFRVGCKPLIPLCSMRREYFCGLIVF